MITLFCLLVYSAFPSQLGIPFWVVILCLALDILLFSSGAKRGKR